MAEENTKKEKIGFVTLDYSKYPGEDFYCDGAVEDELLQIVRETAPEEFAGIIEERGSWPILYHLSSIRENIVEWLPMDKHMKVLEVGSGCGAITGVLARKAGNVTCVELSQKRTLINAYRHRDCDNIEIHVGNFKDIEPDLPTDYDYILLIGVLVATFCSRQNVKRASQIVIGFGILFLGLQTMSSAMAGMRDMPQIVNFLGSLKNPILATITGMVLTAIIQSSSVTVSIVLLMANQDLLTLPICIYIILGCNIGACATALLTSLSGKKDAKRAALIHFWFNVIGTVLIYIILIFAMDPVISMISAISSDNGRFVANAHTIIKVFQVIVLFPFSNWIVKLSIACVPGEDRKINYRESYQLKYIGEKVVFNPATAVVEVIKELERMADLASENLNRAMNALITLDEEDIEEVYEVEKNINFLNHSITDYLVKINQSTLPIEDLKSLGALFHVVNDIERIGDHAENVADAVAFLVSDQAAYITGQVIHVDGGMVM